MWRSTPPGAEPIGQAVEALSGASDAARLWASIATRPPPAGKVG